MARDANVECDDELRTFGLIYRDGHSAPRCAVRFWMMDYESQLVCVPGEGGRGERRRESVRIPSCCRDMHLGCTVRGREWWHRTKTLRVQHTGMFTSVRHAHQHPNIEPETATNASGASESERGRGDKYAGCAPGPLPPQSQPVAISTYRTTVARKPETYDTIRRDNTIQ